MNPVRSNHDSEARDIRPFQIDTAYQGRGLAVKLTQAFLDHCRSRGVSRCSVNASKANLAAHRICTHVGFRVEREFTVDERPAVVYRLDFRTNDGRERMS